MKKTGIIILLAFIFSCSNNSENNCNKFPELTANTATNITENSATLNGNIIKPECDSNLVNQGFVFGTSVQPTISNSTQFNVNGTNILKNLTDLEANTDYYYRVFYTDNNGTYYSNEVSLKTSIGETIIENLPAQNITSNEAQLVANISSDGNSDITERGFVYSKSQNPTTNDNKVISGSGKGSYSATASSLEPNAKYYYRAYAINAKGITYSSELEFTTLCLVADGTMNFGVERNNGNISVTINYSLNIPTTNFNLTSISVILESQVGNIERTIPNDQTQGSIKIENLTPKTRYENIKILINSSDCGNAIVSPDNPNYFITPQKYDIGDEAEGGIIIYMYDNGINGIAAAKTDAGKGNWFCAITGTPSWQGMKPTATNSNNISNWLGEIGDGENYSQAIYEYVTNGGGNSSSGYFANSCNCINNAKAIELAYNYSDGVYSDWYLPHIKTLNLMYQLYSNGVLNGFSSISNPCQTASEPFYVSSSGGGSYAGSINFSLSGNNQGAIISGSAGAIYKVRAVRKF